MGSYSQDPITNIDFGKWEDSRMDTTDTRAGATSPPLANFLGNLNVANFNAGFNRTIYTTMQMTHRLNRLFPLHPHVHFAPSIDIPIGATVKWQFEYVRTSHNQVLPGASVSETVTFSRSVLVPAKTSIIVQFSPISTAAFGLSDILICRLTRESAGGGADTFLGDCWLYGFDLHYKVENAGGSKEEY